MVANAYRRMHCTVNTRPSCLVLVYSLQMVKRDREEARETVRPIHMVQARLGSMEGVRLARPGNREGLGGLERVLGFEREPPRAEPCCDLIVRNHESSLVGVIAHHRSTLDKRVVVCDVICK